PGIWLKPLAHQTDLIGRARPQGRSGDRPWRVPYDPTGACPSPRFEVRMAADLRVKEGLPDVTEALVASYTECSRINHLGHQALPSPEAVTDILADLYEVIYPGFGRRQHLHIGNVEYYVGSLVDALHDKLTEQIARALRHDMCEEAPHIDIQGLAQGKAVEFLKRLPAVRDVLDKDVAAAFR